MVVMVIRPRIPTILTSRDNQTEHSVVLTSNELHVLKKTKILGNGHFLLEVPFFGP